MGLSDMMGKAAGMIGGDFDIGEKLGELGVDASMLEGLDLEAAKSFIADKGFDAKYGARPIRRAIQEYIEDFIAEEVLGKGIVEGKKYSLKINKDSEKISVTEKK